MTNCEEAAEYYRNKAEKTVEYVNLMWRTDTPPEEEMVLVSVKDETGDTPNWYTDIGFHYKDIWVVNNEVTSSVIAWAEFPKPFKR